MSHAAAAVGADRVLLGSIGVTVAPELSAMRLEGPGRDHEAAAPLTTPAGGLGFGGARRRELHDVGSGHAMLEATPAPDPDAPELVGAALPSGGLAGQLLGPAATGLALYGGDVAVLDGRMAVLPKP